MRCPSPAANISSSMMPRTGPSPISSACVAAFREVCRTSPACRPAQYLQRVGQLATRQFTLEYCALFDGLLPALDRLQPADPARRHVQSFPRSGAQMADGVGPVQRHRGCRSRHAARAERLSLRDAPLDHLRRGAAPLDVMAPPAHALAQGLCADLARAYAFAASAVARARAARLPRLPDRGGRHNSVGAGASLVLRARRDRSRAGKPARAARELFLVGRSGYSPGSTW